MMTTSAQMTFYKGTVVMPFTVAPRIMKYEGENFLNTQGICVPKTTDVSEHNQRRADILGGT